MGANEGDGKVPEQRSQTLVAKCYLISSFAFEKGQKVTGAIILSLTRGAAALRHQPESEAKVGWSGNRK
jgi:hypothetical protein